MVVLLLYVDGCQLIVNLSIFLLSRLIKSQNRTFGPAKQGDLGDLRDRANMNRLIIGDLVNTNLLNL